MAVESPPLWAWPVVIGVTTFVCKLMKADVSWTISEPIKEEIKHCLARALIMMLE